MKLIHIVGARPQFIKTAAVCRAMDARNDRLDSSERVEEVVIHTGQHYDYGMSEVFFDELKIPKPDYNLGVGSASHGEQTGEMLKRVEPVLEKEIPDVVLVYGDTNSTLAGALAAAKLHIPVAHIEAGLRSFNKSMPEEVNRVLTDHVSDVLFCPTEAAVKNLKREGFTNIVNDGRLIPASDSDFALAADYAPPVLNVGDVMYDSVLYNLKLAEKRSDILARLHLLPNKLTEPNQPYAVATVHRAENTDDPERLRSIFRALREIARSTMPVIIPLHPRTRKQLDTLSNPTDCTDLFIIDPVSYLDMLLLEKNAAVILTDSGGVQKEAFILRVPCITLREETEWVETVEGGWNVLAGAEEGSILEAIDHFARAKPVPPQADPYGDGHAAERIVNVLARLGR